MRCPGQDPRYWRQDAVFEVPCPECGAAVELFKDESTGRCTSCGHKFPNPGIDFGCAKWCSLAEQCVGFIPEGQLTSGPKEGALAGRLIQEVKEAFGADPDRVGRSLRVYHYAKELTSKEGGDPRVVLAAALLLGIGSATPGPQTTDRPGRPSRARQILQQIGAGDETIGRVCRIVESHQAGRPADSIEFRIVQDADALARLAAEAPAAALDALEDAANAWLHTDAAKEKARTLFRA
jgi:hypothetical protein